MAKVSDIVMQAAMPVSGAAGVQSQTQPADKNAFSDIMDKARKAGEQAGQDLMDMAKPQSKDAGTSAKGTYEKDSRSDVKRDNISAKDNVKKDTAEKTGKTEKGNAVKENTKTEKAAGNEGAVAETTLDEAQTEQLCQEVIADAAQALGISQDELLSIMEMLGLSVADLMQTGNVAQIVAQAMNVEGADIVVSEELTGMVMDIAAVASEDLQAAADQLGMSLEELTAKIEEQVSAAANAPAFESVETVQEVTVDVQNTALAQEQIAPVVQNTEKADVKTDDADEKVEAVDTQDDAETVINKTQSETVSAENTAKENEGGHKGRSNNNDGNADKNQMQLGAAGTAPVADQNTTVTTEPLTEGFGQRLDMERTRDVIQQITEHAKITGGDKLTNMELMLNPANLGSIRLMIQSENGVIRGQLTASDEAVRAALESQLQQLRDALVEQGMKVDALEVTVAGHQLEQNLDQSGQQAEQQAEDMAARKDPRRILDLGADDIEETIEQMTDAERLEVEMMRMGGNRLNFQA